MKYRTAKDLTVKRKPNIMDTGLVTMKPLMHWTWQKKDMVYIWKK